MTRIVLFRVHHQDLKLHHKAQSNSFYLKSMRLTLFTDFKMPNLSGAVGCLVLVRKAKAGGGADICGRESKRQRQESESGSWHPRGTPWGIPWEFCSGVPVLCLILSFSICADSRTGAGWSGMSNSRFSGLSGISLGLGFRVLGVCRQCSWHLASASVRHTRRRVYFSMFFWNSHPHVFLISSSSN